MSLFSYPLTVDLDIRSLRDVDQSHVAHSSIRWALSGSFALLISAVGCGHDGPERRAVYPVQGQITLQGKPLANALVVLHPHDDSDPQAVAVRGVTDREGHFQATTYDANDGAPAGEYRLTVQCYQLKGKKGSFEPGPNILSPKLSLPTSSNIAVTVAERANVLPAIEVRRERRTT